LAILKLLKRNETQNHFGILTRALFTATNKLLR